MSPEERRAALISTHALLFTRILLKVASVSFVSKIATSHGKRSPITKSIPIERFIEFLRSNRIGASCLAEAIVVQSILSRKGVPAAIKIGVKESEGRLTAHAWVESEGSIIYGAPVDSYTPLEGVGKEAR